MANLSCLIATTISSLRFFSNSYSSLHFNLLRVARYCFMWFSVFLFSRLILFFPLSSVSEALFALIFPFLKESCLVHAKVALSHSRMSNTGVLKLTLSMHVRNSAYAFWIRLTYIYHAKSRLDTPVWGSLQSPNNT